MLIEWPSVVSLLPATTPGKARLKRPTTSLSSRGLAAFQEQRCCGAVSAKPGVGGNDAQRARVGPRRQTDDLGRRCLDSLTKVSAHRIA